MKAGIITTIASLMGAALGQSCPDAGADGFASVGSGTTGGGDANPIVVSNDQDLRTAAETEGPAVIVIQGTIDTRGVVQVTSDKTIIGQDANSGVIGGFAMDAVSNVIIKNLNIEAGEAADALASTRSDHIWYDHLHVFDAADGLLDITRESDYQTVSWCKFSYSDGSAEHRLASLVSSGGGTQPNDEGKLRVTYHHNWWAENVDQRMPRVMYGEAHIYNNFFDSAGNSYCIGFGSYGSVLIQRNYFKGVKNPHQFMYDVYAFSEASDNVYDNVTGDRHVGRFGDKDAEGHNSHSANPFNPPYDFSVDNADDLPALVERCAGPQ